MGRYLAMLVVGLCTLFAPGCPEVTTGDAGAGDGVDAGSGGHDASGRDAARDATIPQFDGAVIGGLRVNEIDVDSAPNSTMNVFEIWGLYDRPFALQIFGVVREGMWQVALREGACVYLTEIMPGFCTPGCTTEQYCDVDDVCQPYPLQQSAGPMTLTGLTSTVTLTPTGDGNYDTSGTPTANMFEPGATVTLTAAGADLPAFTVSTTAPVHLTPAIPCPVEPVAGQDLIVTWDAGDGDLVRWEMISAFHAGDGPMVLCEGPDTGSLTVPAAIIDRYLVDRTAYETMQLSRLQRAPADVGNGRLLLLETVSMRICF